MPAASGGPGWPLASALFERGTSSGLEVVEAIGGGDLEHAIPVERCFYWEELATVELARSDLDAAARYVDLAEEQAARLGLALPIALARRGARRCCWRARTRRVQPRPPRSRRRSSKRSARACPPPTRS